MTDAQPLGDPAGRHVAAHTDPDGWTVTTLKLYYDALLAANDRRLSEVKVENEKALIIKNTADEAALRLARESQTYKEQQNDALRDKNLSQSGVYATNAGVAEAIGKLEESLAPVFKFVATQQGSAKQGDSIWNKGTTFIASIVAIAALAYSVLGK